MALRPGSRPARLDLLDADDLQPIGASPSPNATPVPVPESKFHTSERAYAEPLKPVTPRLTELVRGASAALRRNESPPEPLHPFSPSPPAAAAVAPNAARPRYTRVASAPALAAESQSGTGSGTGTGTGTSARDATSTAVMEVARYVTSPRDATVEKKEVVQRVVQQALAEFGSGALVIFHWGAFLREIAYHLVQPLVIPLIWWLEGGSAGLRNRAFLPKQWAQRSFWFGTASWACFCAVVLLFALGATTTDISSYEFAFFCLIFVSRIVVIAVKYAFFTDEDWERMRARVFSDEEVRRSMIIIGWGDYDVELIERELLFAYQRTGVFLCNRNMYFRFSPEDRSHPGFLQRLERAFPNRLQLANGDSVGAYDKWREGMRRGEASVRLYCLQLLRNVNRAVSGRKFWTVMCMFIAWFQALLPSLLRVWNGENFFGSNAADAVFVVCEIPATVYIHFANALYLRIAIVDYRRRLNAMQQLSRVLSARETGATAAAAGQPGSSSLVALPPVDFHDHRNIYHWIALRHVVKDFGAAPYARVQAFSSFFMAAAVLLIGFTLYVVLNEDEADGTVAHQTLLALSGFILFCTVWALFRMTLLARKINTIHREHSYILARMQVLLARKVILLDETDAADREAWGKTITALQSAINVVQASDSNYPVRIIGFEASGNFLRALLTLGVVGVAVWFQAVWQSIDDST